MRLIVLFVVLCLCACAGKQVWFEIDSNQILYIYDGDTFTIRCQSNLRCDGDKIKVRVWGVDTPELKGKCEREIELARESKRVAVDLLRSADSITIMYDSKHAYDKYGRLLGHVFINDVNLANILIDSGNGREYYGGHRSGWCENITME